MTRHSPPGSVISIDQWDTDRLRPRARADTRKTLRGGIRFVKLVVMAAGAVSVSPDAASTARSITATVQPPNMALTDSYSGSAKTVH